MIGNYKQYTDSFKMSVVQETHDQSATKCWIIKSRTEHSQMEETTVLQLRGSIGLSLFVLFSAFTL